jgi:1,4-dihydroxy-2-naphthoyl-CoA hydrolase
MDERVTAMIRDAMPLAALLGLEGVEAEPAAVVVRGAWAAERCTAGGVLHGGYLMTLADAAAATLAYLNLPPGTTTATIEAKTNFLAAVREGTVTARAELVHAGRRTIVVQVDVTDDDGRLVTRTLQTQAVIGADGGG